MGRKTKINRLKTPLAAVVEGHQQHRARESDSVDGHSYHVGSQQSTRFEKQHGETHSRQVFTYTHNTRTQCNISLCGRRQAGLSKRKMQHAKTQYQHVEGHQPQHGAAVGKESQDSPRQQNQQKIASATLTHNTNPRPTTTNADTQHITDRSTPHETNKSGQPRFDLRPFPALTASYGRKTPTTS